MKLIDKDALIAKIEKEIKCIYAGREYVGIPSNEENIIIGIQKVEDIIDTLEVKDVDLEKEIEKEIGYNYNPVDGLSFEEFRRIAKYFAEFGIKAQKGEEV